MNPHSASGAAAPAPSPRHQAAVPRVSPATRRIVDAPTRVFHGLFALSFLGAYLTAEGERLRLLHVTLGYTMAGLLVFRVLYGLLGPRHARLSVLWRKLHAAPQWLSSLWGATQALPARAVNWRQGQNLMMALAVVVLLLLVAPLTASGYGAFNEWGDVWAELHELSGNLLLAVVLGHVGLVLGLSVWRRKNIAMQMVSGRIEGPGPDVAQRNHVWLAILLLVAVLAYWRWEWQQAPNGLVSAQAVGDLMGGRGHDADD